MTNPSDDPMQRTKLEDQVEPEMLNAIGLAIATAGTTESSLGLQILRIVGGQNRFDVGALPLVGGMQIRVKLNIIRILCAARHPNEAKEISRICDGIQDAFSNRDVIAHSVVMPNEANKGRYAFRDLRVNKDGRMPDPTMFTIEDVRSIAHRLLALSLDLDQKLTALGFAKL